MTLEQILEALQIPLCTENRGAEIACAPSCDAELRRDGAQTFVWIRRSLSDWRVSAAYENGMLLSEHVDNVLHEAMHAMCGPSSTDDEGMLMAVQWHVMNELTPDEFKAARRGFARYGHVWGEGDLGCEIGDTDEFLETSTWKALVEQAIDQGFLVRLREQVQVVWGHGVHAQWLE